MIHKHIKEDKKLVECSGEIDCPLCQLFGAPDICIPIFDHQAGTVTMLKISQRTALKVFGEKWHEKIPSSYTGRRKQ